jgi:DNA-binding transcriptional MerR regulator
MLAPPERRGRVGYYSQSHVDRLKEIAKLQERGFSLAAIKDLLAGFEQGASLGQVLDLRLLGEESELGPEELLAVFPEAGLDQAVAQRAFALGLMRLDPQTGAIRVPSRSFVEVGRLLGAHGVPAQVALDEYEALAEDTQRIAQRFVALFESYVVGVEVDGLAVKIAQFRQLAAAAVDEMITLALDEAAAEAVARHAVGNQ